MAFKPLDIIIRAKDESGPTLVSIHGLLKTIAGTIATYFGISAFVNAVRSAGDLEAKLSEVKAVTGASADEMRALRTAAEEAGASTKFTATQSAEALGNLARAGLSAKDSITALPAVLSLAQAGGVGLGEAAEFVTKAVMGMGLQFGDAGRVADVLAAGANASNTSVVGLAQALSYTAPIANSVGLSLEQTVAVLGKFADAGIDASRAGTGLNAILSQFADPASKFRTELAAIGITTVNFDQALRELAKSGSAGQKSILAVGTEAGPALRALLNQGIGALDDLKGKLDSAKGSAAEVAKVMGDNLNGSLSGLSSMWDTVRNTLTTPVLPVLKDGVDRLVASLKSAVDSGLVGRFGQALATGFESAITWATKFAQQVDFEAMAQKLRGYADEAQATFVAMGEAATNAGAIVNTAWGVMSAGTNVVLGVIYTVGEGFASLSSRVLDGVALLLEGLAKITFGGVAEGFKAAAEEIRIAAGGANAASEALAQKATAAFVAVEAGAVRAREGWSKLTETAQTGDAQVKASEQAIATLSGTLKEMGGAAEESSQRAVAASVRLKNASEDAREKVADLKTQYEAAVANGNWQLAAEKLLEIKKALEAGAAALTDLSRKAKETEQEIAAAFSRVGIKTKDELKLATTAALKDYDLIKSSGQATAEGLAAAWQRVFDASAAANNGVVSETLKARAAMDGLNVATDSAGRTIVSSMNQAQAATSGLTTSFAHSTAAVQEHADALERLAMRYTITANYSQRQIQLLEQEAAASEKAAAAERQRLAVDKEGFSTDKSGNRLVAGSDLSTRTGIAAFLKAAGVDDEAAARRIANEFANSKGEVDYFNNSGQKKYGGDTISMALLRAAETYTFSGANSKTSSVPAQTQTININLGGRTTPITVASSADADALRQVLQQMATAAGRAA